MAKLITWLDLDGRYRITSPCYADPVNQGVSEAVMTAFTIVKLRIRYGLSITHVFHEVEQADFVAKTQTLGGEDFWRGGIPRDSKRGMRDGTGKLLQDRDTLDGAWEMDTDGTPKVDMAKAPAVQMDLIRVARKLELEVQDEAEAIAISKGDNVEVTRVRVLKQALRDLPTTFDLSGATTPNDLHALWPAELPARS